MQLASVFILDELQQFGDESSFDGSGTSSECFNQLVIRGSGLVVIICYLVCPQPQCILQLKLLVNPTH